MKDESTLQHLNPMESESEHHNHMNHIESESEHQNEWVSIRMNASLEHLRFFSSESGHQIFLNLLKSKSEHHYHWDQDKSSHHRLKSVKHLNPTKFNKSSMCE